MQERIEYIIDEMKRVYLNDDRPWIIGYSGGKDSTVVVQLVYEMLLRLEDEEKNKMVYVVSSNTLIENPIILNNLKETINLIDEGAKRDKLPLETEIVIPRFDDSFWTNVIGKGFPTPKSATFRWCTPRLKIDPSNRFIEERVDESGEAIVLLGVRKAESAARRESIEKREVDEFILSSHPSLRNTFVYSPIVEMTTDDVWEFLLSNGGRNPWDGDNNYLFDLYADGDGGECPFIISTNQDNEEIVTPSCGNTRFGCWVCTVVNEDKSLMGFIESGEEWLIPLIRFREWIVDNRDNRKYRAKNQRTGRIYRIKVMINTISEEEKKAYLDEGYTIEKDEKGKEFFWAKGLGPFNYEGRQVILRKLLETQKEIGIDLISIEELKEIEKIWHREFDIERDALCNIYEEVLGQKLPWANLIEPILKEDIIDEMDKALEEFGVEKDLYYRLLILTEENKIYSNKTNYKNSVNKILNEQWLHRQVFDEEYKDGN